MNSSTIAHEARRTPQWFPELPELLNRALHEYDLKGKGDIKDLANLADEVIIGAMSVRGEYSVVSDDCWVAPGSLSVTLIGKGDDQDTTELQESFPIRVRYKVDSRKVTIESVEIDLTSF